MTRCTAFLTSDSMTEQKWQGGGRVVAKGHSAKATDGRTLVTVRRRWRRRMALNTLPDTATASPLTHLVACSWQVHRWH